MQRYSRHCSGCDSGHKDGFAIDGKPVGVALVAQSQKLNFYALAQALADYQLIHRKCDRYSL